MGALHAGHVALLKKCHKENQIAILSIFVNPTQFGPQEDYHAYPRTRRHDLELAASTGCQIAFCPSTTTMYPEQNLTTINVAGVSEGLCGKTRPGHFQGVATVVTKLLNIIQPHTAYFGQKDYQQVAVIKKMAADLNMPVKIRVVATQREKDGLAMSSRNIYLSPQERKDATILYQSLVAAKKRIAAGERRADVIQSSMRTMIMQTPATIDYIECVDANTLEPVSILHGKVVIAVAAVFGKARLIDNIVLQI